MIVNVTKDKVVAEEYSRAVSGWEQFRGLMFRKVSPVVFEFPSVRRVSLHSFFCFGSMDLVFVNDDWEVVELFREWGPFRFYSSRFPAKFLVELPAGSIFRSSTEVGDIIHFK